MIENLISTTATIAATAVSAVYAGIATATINLVFRIPVPFTSETPEGSWARPWNNACEEASIAMVEAWYRNKTTITTKEAVSAMRAMFNWEDAHIGGNANTDASQTLAIIQAKASFSARVVRNPTLDELKEELRNGRPIISLHFGYELNNPLHRWARNGSYYHMMVLVGFDEHTQEFLVHDTALEDGLDYRYSYATILKSLHDYDRTRAKTDGPPTVIFTAPGTSTSSQLFD
mgnify:CR=1 FL=1